MLDVTRVVPLLKVLLVLGFAAIVVLQVMSVPGTLAYAVEQNPDFDQKRWVLLVVLELELVCLQAVIVCTWQLLGMVRADRIFSDDAFRWVDGIVAALTVGWLAWAGLAAYVALTSDDPGLPMVMAMSVLAGAAVGLLMLVMRTLLRQAATLRADMDAVI